jgi:hypothetical protein
MSKKKSEKPRFYGQNKLFFENPVLQPLGSFSHMAECRSCSENTWKMSLILVFNKNSPPAHTELELGVLGVHGKLVKYVDHSSKRKNWKKIKKSSHKLPKQQSTSFWFQGILGVKACGKSKGRQLGGQDAIGFIANMVRAWIF